MCWQDTEKLQSSCIVGGSPKWYSHSGKNSLAVSYKVKPLLYICSFLGDYPREMKIYVHIQTYTQIAALFIILKN